MEKLKKIFRIYMTMRRSGTTELIKKIANENDVFVLAPNAKSAKNFRGGISIQTGRLNGSDRKPILIDNSVLGCIGGAIEEFEFVSEQNESNKAALLRSLDREIETKKQLNRRDVAIGEMMLALSLAKTLVGYLEEKERIYDSIALLVYVLIFVYGYFSIII